MINFNDLCPLCLCSAAPFMAFSRPLERATKKSVEMDQAVACTSRYTAIARRAVALALALH
jgi:hypothetical protein